MNIYGYQRPLGRIDDVSGLRAELIAVYDAKSHKDMARFCMAYGRHLLDVMGYEPFDESIRAFEAIQEWLDGKTWYQKARNAGGVFNDMARNEKDAVNARFFRTMAQIACVPHVKYHALWAADFAVTLINRIHPGGLEKVREEREKQLEIIKSL